jgi:hypothetical protein
VAVPAPTAFGSFSNLVSDGELIGRAYFLWEPADLGQPDGSGRETVVFVLRPTLPNAPKDPVAQPGDWLVRPISVGRDLGSFPLDLFIQRDDTIPGYRSGGRQSRFDDTAYQLFDASGRIVETDQGANSPILRSGTLNGLVSSPSVHLVGAASRSGLQGLLPTALGFSGLGFNFGDPPRFRRGPDWLAATENSDVLRRPIPGGILTAGTRSGSYKAVNGTSFAAPQLARALAEGLLGVDWSQESAGSDPGQVFGLGGVDERRAAMGIVAPL